MVQRGVSGGMTVLVIDRLEAVEVEIDQSGRCVVAFGQRQRAANFAQEGAAVQHRQHHVVIGQGFQFADAAAQAFGFLAELVDFAHQ